MAAAPRQMTLIGFLQAQNCSNYVGSWRHPATAPDFLSPTYYRRIASALESGCFDLAFFDDRLALPDILGDDYRAAVENGIRVVKMDPSTILTVMGAATRGSVSARPTRPPTTSRSMSPACSRPWI